MRLHLLFRNCMRFPQHEFRKMSTRTYVPNIDNRASYIDISYFAGKDLSILVKTKVSVVDSHGPNKEPRGTVIALHGSPGSHNDYKYMFPKLEALNIRTICIDYPGYKFTDGGLEHSYRNDERNNFVEEVVKKMDLKSAKNLIVLGHSRAGENSLQMADRLSEAGFDIIASIPINSTGLRKHRGVGTRYETIQNLARLIKLQSSFINFFLHPMLYYFYNNIVGLRVPSGKVASAAILPLTTFAFEKQKETIAKLDKNTKVRVFFGFGTDDYILETEVSEEIAYTFENVKMITENAKSDSLEETKEAIRAGVKNIAGRFIGAGHYLQKSHADYMVEVIDEYIKSQQK